jgi:hypothetical protein
VSGIVPVALDDHGSDRSPFRPQRNTEPVHGDRAQEVDLTVIDQLLDARCRDQHGTAGPEQVRGQSPGLPRPHRLPDVRIGKLGIDLVHEERPIHRLPLLVIEHDVEVVRVHQLTDDAVDLGVELPHVLRGARRLRDPVQGSLNPLRAPALGLRRFELGETGARKGEFGLEFGL